MLDGGEGTLLWKHGPVQRPPLRTVSLPGRQAGVPRSTSFWGRGRQGESPTPREGIRGALNLLGSQRREHMKKMQPRQQAVGRRKAKETRQVSGTLPEGHTVLHPLPRQRPSGEPGTLTVPQGQRACECRVGHADGSRCLGHAELSAAEHVYTLSVNFGKFTCLFPLADCSGRP